MDKKLTDSEIVKIKKRLKDIVEENELEYFHSNTMGWYPEIRLAYMAIKHLQAEKEQYKANSDSRQTNECENIDVVRFEAEIDRQKAENERLEKAIKVLEIMTDQHAYALKKAKAEAYKECIEKVKEYIDTHEHLSCEECECVPISKNGLDNLLNELVGGDNEQSNT